MPGSARRRRVEPLLEEAADERFGGLIAGIRRGMRIVAGDVPLAPSRRAGGPGTRPTSDRAREALFAMLGDVGGDRVLDCFAGSGALGWRRCRAARRPARSSSATAPPSTRCAGTSPRSTSPTAARLRRPMSAAPRVPTPRPGASTICSLIDPPYPYADGRSPCTRPPSRRSRPARRASRAGVGGGPTSRSCAGSSSTGGGARAPRRCRSSPARRTRSEHEHRDLPGDVRPGHARPSRHHPARRRPVRPRRRRRRPQPRHKATMFTSRSASRSWRNRSWTWRTSRSLPFSTLVVEFARD